MKLTFLGTAAAEGMPAVFCNCAYCNEAKRLGGKNIRTRSQAMINDDLLIDLPADTYHHFLQNGIRGDRIRHLLVTHSHSDHFYPAELGMRKPPYAHDMQVPTLQIYCGQGTYDKLEAAYPEPVGFSYDLMKPFETVIFGSYTVTALPARHYPGDGALFYIIRGEKTVLYAHDTGYFYEEVFAYLEKEKLRFDLATFDCTNVDLPRDYECHMGIHNIQCVADRLEKLGAIDKNTVKVINHFSHNGNPIHHRLEAQVKDLGYLVAYDGMCVEF